MTQSSSPRIYKWDNVKGVLICLVVIGHVFQYNLSGSDACRAISLFIWSFHMPLFVFIAGLFHRNTRIREKVAFYLVLGAALRILIFVVKVLICGKSGELDFLQSNSVPWFMFSMAAWIVLTWLFREASPVFVLGASLLLGCFAGYDPDINDFLVLSRTIVFFPFYWAGYCLQGKSAFTKLIGVREGNGTQEKSANKTPGTIAGAALILIWAAICVFQLDAVYVIRPFFSGNKPFSVIGEVYAQTFLGLGMRALCYLISTVLGLAVIMVMPDRRLPFLSKWGQATLSIFFWHRPILYLLDDWGLLDACFAQPHGWVPAALVGLLLTLVLGLDVFGKPLQWLRRMIYR